MSKKVLVITGGGIARYMTISGQPSKYGLIDVPKGTIGHTGSTRLMTVAGQPETTSPSDPDIHASAATSIPLSILDTPLESAPAFIKHDEVIPGVRIPKYLPRDSKFIATVEWPLRPGDTRVEAYFIGSNSSKKHWFLMQCTVDDLSPYETKYLSRRTIAMVKKGGLKSQEAAVLLLNCAWQYEKAPFFMVSNCGLLDLTTVNEIADIVWPEQDGGAS